VLVIGAGPGGLESARAAAARGHRVTLAEASHQIGGQFRLAGMQPRRAQILDLLDWYEGQLQSHQVDLRLNTPMEAAEVEAFGADVAVIATGSLPDESGFQRFGPDVMSRACRPGKRVLVLDDGGNWRGCGTAWHLAEQDHAVTLLTPEGVVGKELARSAADVPLRSALTRLGVAFITDSAIKQWHGDGATIVNLLDGSERRENYDALILATPPMGLPAAIWKCTPWATVWRPAGRYTPSTKAESWEYPSDGRQRSPSTALPAEAADAAVLCRGRHADGSLPPLSRGEGKGGYRAHHDCRIRRGRRGFAACVRQSPRL
jgi:hypothetical protein